ncbi:MAG: hypothetical protein AB7P04_07930 [Bacteriovoracia bacterium]
MDRDHTVRLAKLAVASFVLTAAGTAQAGYFGSRGLDGFNGTSGMNGRDGQSAAVFADGRSLTLDLRGTDGGDGTDGRPGGDASFCFQPYNAMEDLWGAEGGDGGNGGWGGNGGNGGELTVFVEDLTNLGKIRVDQTPGRGGKGGNEFRRVEGGDGCRCSQWSWTVRVCDNYNPPNCVYRTYYCREGARGRDGSRGVMGSPGQYGNIVLVPGRADIPPQAPETTLPVDDTLTKKEVILTRNRFSRQGGALELFAPGSQIRDDYYRFEKLETRTVTFLWNSPRPITDFANQRLTLAFSREYTVGLQVPSALWWDIQRTDASERVLYDVKQAVFRTEAMGLRLGALKGSGKDLELAVDDPAGVSDVVATEYELEFETWEILKYKSRFNAKLDANLVQVGKNQSVIYLGKLIDVAKIPDKYFKAKKKIRITLRAKRSLGRHAETWQQTEVKLEIPKS